MRSCSSELQGFTLIEIMVVLAIIGILAAIAIPQYSGYKIEAQDSSARSALRNLADAQENYYIQHDTYTSNRNSLKAVSGWTVNRLVTVSIKAANEHSWSATASHISSPHTFRYTSAGGGLFTGP